MTNQTKQPTSASLARLARAVDKTDRKSALDFLHFAADQPVLVCDCSGSMGTHDFNDEEAGSRYDRLDRELAAILHEFPEAQIVAFSDEPTFARTPLPRIGGGTKVAPAIRLAASTRPNQMIVLSDGEPADPDRAIDAARCFGGRIDTIYIGPKGGIGQEFLQRLASAASGKFLACGSFARGEIADKVRLMLTT